jgi:short-subunit dehydrogenase
MAEQKTTALVTGASSGIGAEFCRQLAARCEVVIAVGRNSAKLSALARELTGQVEVHVLSADLATLEGITRCIEMLRQKGPVDYLVNNAGFAVLGNFADLELAPQQEMVDVHVTATLALCRAAIPFMRQRGGGYIVNVSSLAAFYPIPACSVYGASKVFLNLFSEALALEEKSAGIKVQSLCPGFTRSSFHDREGMADFDRALVPDEEWMEAAAVVQESLAQLEGQRVVVVTGDDNLQIACSSVETQLANLSS